MSGGTASMTLQRQRKKLKRMFEAAVKRSILWFPPAGEEKTYGGRLRMNLDPGGFLTCHDIECGVPKTQALHHPSI